MPPSTRIYSALRASLIHFLISLVVALSAAFLVFSLWYPNPYRALLSVEHIFLLLIAIDVVCGPILTLIFWNPNKSKKELKNDLTVIAFLQIAALIYGISTIAAGRPVYSVYEVDRFRVVTATEVDSSALNSAINGLKNLPWSGPLIIGTRTPINSQELLNSIDLSLAGQEPSLRPNWWTPYEKVRETVKARMKPLPDLYSWHSERSRELIDNGIQSTGTSLEKLHYLPLVSHSSLDSWIVLLNQEAKIVGYANVGGFKP